MPIDYDPRIESLIHPERRETVFAAGATPSLVQIAVEASRLAYYRAEADPAQHERLAQALRLAGFGEPTLFCSTADTQAFGAFDSSHGVALVAFRGTQPDSLEDIGIDAVAAPVAWPGAGRVHAGFAYAFAGVRAPIEAWLSTLAPTRRTLLLCGHSLGAALATLAASAWQPSRLITIGSPLVGDADFVASLDRVQVDRIVDCCDLVTRVPPQVLGYRHTPSPVIVDWQGKLMHEPSAADIALDRHAGRNAYLAQYALHLGNVPARDLADHAPVNYLRAFFS